MIFTEEYFIEQNKEQGARNKVSFIFISRKEKKTNGM
tara:strand:+ start:653 stop:763 length:111 start_codon:yes stop_codon:yes gene_type:complete